MLGPKWPLKRLYKFALKKVIGRFLLQPLEIDQLDVDLITGIVQLNNLALNAQVINDILGANSPIVCCSGHLQEVKVTIPWKHLVKDNCLIELKGFTLNFCAAAENDFGPGESMTHSTASLAKSSNTMAESIKFDDTYHSEDDGDHMSGKKNEDMPIIEGLEVLERLVERVLSRTRVQISDLSIRLVHTSKETHSHHVFSLTIPWIDYTDQSPRQEVLDPGPTHQTADVRALDFVKSVTLRGSRIEYSRVTTDEHPHIQTEQEISACLQNARTLLYTSKDDDWAKLKFTLPESISPSSTPFTSVNFELDVRSISIALLPSDIALLSEMATVCSPPTPPTSEAQHPLMDSVRYHLSQSTRRSKLQPADLDTLQSLLSQSRTVDDSDTHYDSDDFHDCDDAEEMLRSTIVATCADMKASTMSLIDEQQDQFYSCIMSKSKLQYGVRFRSRSTTLFLLYDTLSDGEINALLEGNTLRPNRPSQPISQNLQNLVGKSHLRIDLGNLQASMHNEGFDNSSLIQFSVNQLDVYEILRVQRKNIRASKVSNTNVVFSQMHVLTFDASIAGLLPVKSNSSYGPQPVRSPAIPSNTAAVNLVIKTRETAAVCDVDLKFLPILLNLDVGLLERVDNFFSGKTEADAIMSIVSAGETNLFGTRNIPPTPASIPASSSSAPASDMSSSIESMPRSSHTTASNRKTMRYRLSMQCPRILIQAFFVHEVISPHRNSLYRPEVMLVSLADMKATNANYTIAMDEEDFGTNRYAAEAEQVVAYISDQYISLSPQPSLLNNIREIFNCSAQQTVGASTARPKLELTFLPPLSYEFVEMQRQANRDAPPVKPWELNDSTFRYNIVKSSRYFLRLHFPLSTLTLSKNDFHLVMDLLDISSDMLDIGAGFSYAVNCGINDHSIFHTPHCTNASSPVRCCADLTKSAPVKKDFRWLHLATTEILFAEGKWVYQEAQPWRHTNSNNSASRGSGLGNGNANQQHTMAGNTLGGMRVPYKYEWSFKHQKLRHIAQYYGRPVVSMMFLADDVTLSDHMTGSFEANIACRSRFAQDVSTPVFQLGYSYSMGGDQTSYTIDRQYRYHITFSNLLFKYAPALVWWEHTMDFLNNEKRLVRSLSTPDLASMGNAQAPQSGLGLEGLSQCTETPSPVKNSLSQLSAELKDCAIEIRPQNLPSRAIITARAVEITASLVQLSTATTIRYRINDLALFLIDDHQHTRTPRAVSLMDTSSHTDRMRASIRDAAFVQLMTITSIDFLTRAWKAEAFAGDQPLFYLECTLGLVLLETCADAFATMVAFLGDWSQPAPAMDTTPTITAAQTIQGSTSILDQIEMSKFKPKRGVGSNPNSPSLGPTSAMPRPLLAVTIVDDFYTPAPTPGSEANNNNAKNSFDADSRQNDNDNNNNNGNNAMNEDVCSILSGAYGGATCSTPRSESNVSLPCDLNDADQSFEDCDWVVYEDADTDFVPEPEGSPHPIQSHFAGYFWGKSMHTERSREYERTVARNLEQQPEQQGGWIEGPPVVREGYMSLPVSPDDDHFSLPHDVKYPRVVSKIVVKDATFCWRMFDGFDFRPRTRDSSSSVPTPSDKEKNNQKGRATDQYMELDLKRIRLCTFNFPEKQLHAWHTRISVKDIELTDCLKTSRWRKFLQYYPHPVEPREYGSAMLDLKLDSVHPDPALTSEELRLKVSLLPLKFHVHQDAVDFFISFFGAASPASTPEADSDRANANRIAPFFQFAEVQPLRVVIDYRPKRMNLKALRQGNFVELLNLLPLEGVEISLKKVSLAGVHGWDQVVVGSLKCWLEDITASQLHKYIVGVQPVKSLVNVGSSMANLVLLPVQQYKKDKRILRGIRQGASSLVKTVTVETINLTTNLAVGAQVLLEHADDILGGTPTDVIKHSANIDRSKFANQPTSADEGLQQAYQSLTRGLSSAKHTLIAIPMEAYDRAGPSGYVKSVIRAVPVAMLQPFIGTSEALSKALLGMRNSLDPHLREIDEAKYKSFSSPIHVPAVPPPYPEMAPVSLSPPIYAVHPSQQHSASIPSLSANTLGPSSAASASASSSSLYTRQYHQMGVSPPSSRARPPTHVNSPHRK